MSPTISFRWSFDHRRIPGPPLPVWSGSVGATARNCRAARLAITTHMYRDTSKPQALPSKRNGLPRGQGSTPPTSQSVHASIAQSNLAVHTRKGRSRAASSPGGSTAKVWRACGGSRPRQVAEFACLWRCGAWFAIAAASNAWRPTLDRQGGHSADQGRQDLRFYDRIAEHRLQNGGDVL